MTAIRAKLRTTPHRIVVVGGGAGGLALATRLGDTLGRRGQAHIVLIDKHPTHLWKPLLHEVAASSMDPFTHQLDYAAQAHWHGFEFQQGEMTGLDRAAKIVRVAAVPDDSADPGDASGNGGSGGDLLPPRGIPYDTLVLAVGSTTHFFGVPGAREHAIALDTPAQAERFRRRLIAACMRAPHAGSDAHASSDADRGAGGKVHVVIVGAGATGVELSAALRHTVQLLHRYGRHRLDPRRDIHITLIEAGPRILPALPERVAAATAALLGKLDVTISVGDPVREVRRRDVVTHGGRCVPADLTVWAAGIKAPGVLANFDGLAVNRIDQIRVRTTLQSETDDDVFAFGDCACCPWPARDISVPPRAQAAHQQATFLYGALRRRLAGRALPEFRYRDFGSLVSLGGVGAVGNLMGGLVGGNLFIEGWLARTMYRSLYRMHVMALHGPARMISDTLAHWFRRATAPRVKLH